MKTIVLGFDNVKGLGDPLVLKGPAVSQHEQIKFLHDAKATNVFPEGVKHIQLCTIEERITAIEVVKAEAKTETKRKK